MKTVKITKNGEYKRLSNDDADYAVNVKKAKFVPKSEWKENVRDFSLDKEVIQDLKKK